jgi:hypothetical protein
MRKAALSGLVTERDGLMGVAGQGRGAVRVKTANLRGEQPRVRGESPP